MSANTDIENENQLLIVFLEGDSIANYKFFEVMNPRILRTARSIAKDLPEDIQEEIAQQTYLNLLYTPANNFNPERGTAWQFLIGQIWNAEKQVRDAYGYPQRRKKKDLQSIESFTTAKQSPKIISIDTEKTVNLPSVNLEKTLEGEFFVRTVIRKAPKPLASALKLICFQDNSKEQAAKAVRLSRFQLHRQITNLRSQLIAA
jgi:hypothetical protein